MASNYTNTSNYTLSYSVVKNKQPKGFRSLLRYKALNLLSIMESIKGGKKYLNKPRVQFLYIHHVFQDEEDKFEKLLSFLSLNHIFISYSEGVERVLSGNIDKPYIVLSSDDGFKNNLNAALIAEKYGAKICFFINPGVIGLSNINTIEEYCAKKLNFPPVEFLTWDDVKLLQNAGHEIGSHTMQHINIAKSTIEEIETDMAASFSILKEKCGDIKHFAFPYGRVFHFSKEGKTACFGAGFYTCASAERGCHVPSKNTFNNTDLYIRRDHIILDWPLSHIKYFLIQSAKNANSVNNDFPENLK
jgi:peptidoglycan/xylan/chitin deacetylase (PgdA/CDA1 family)